jgi:hypothetical protein
MREQVAAVLQIQCRDVKIPKALLEKLNTQSIYVILYFTYYCYVLLLMLRF